MSGQEALVLQSAAYGAQSVSAFGSAYSQATAYQMQGAYQKKMFEMNSALAELQAEDTLKQSERTIQKHRKAVKGLIGEQRVSLAAQGIDVESGSALDVQGDTAMLGKLDEIAIKNNAWREAWGYRMDAVRSSAAGQVAGNIGSFKSDMTLLTGGLNAINYGLQSAYTGSKAYDNWKKAKA